MAKHSLLTAPFPVYLFREQGSFAVLLWAAFSAATVVIAFGIWIWQGGIEASVWALTVQIVRWYPFVIGIHLGWQVLELHVSHGQTRRNFFKQMLTLVPAFAALIAILVLVTYGIEAMIYAAMSWPQAVQDAQWFASSAQVHLMLLQHWLIFTLWMAGGLLIAAAWYRDTLLGVGAMILAIVASGISGISISTDWGPFGFVYTSLTGWETVPGWLGVLLHLAMIAAFLALSWKAIANVDLQPKTA